MTHISCFRVLGVNMYSDLFHLSQLIYKNPHLVRILICCIFSNFYIKIVVYCLSFQIYKGEFTCPSWFSSGAKRLISRILTPNPKHVKANFATFSQILLCCFSIKDNAHFNLSYYTTCFELFFQRITIPQILEDPWFRKGYKPEKQAVTQNINLDDVNAVFSESNVSSYFLGFPNSIP